MNRFLELRNSIGVSQRKMCQLLGDNFYNSHMCELETDKRRPTLTELKAYHDYFHVSYDYLLGATDDPAECNNGEYSGRVFLKLAASNDPDDHMTYQMLDAMLGTHAGLYLLHSLANILYSYDPDHPELYKGVTDKQYKMPLSEEEQKQALDRLIDLIRYMKSHQTDNMRYGELQLMFMDRKGD